MGQASESVEQRTQSGTSATSSGARYPSDEEILGITTEGEASARGDGEIPSASSGQGLLPAEGGTQHDKGREAGYTAADHAEGREAARSTSDEVRDPSTALGASGASAVPEWLKPLLADPRAGKELQALWEASQAYREMFPTVAEARALKELFPGGAEAAKQLVARTQEFDRVDAAYFSGDPGAQAQLAQVLLEDNPRAFLGMLREAAQALASRDPQAFDKLVEQVAQELGSGSVPTRSAEILRPSRLQRDATQDDNLTERQELERQREQVARERTEFERERNDFRSAQFSSFQQAANEVVVSQVRQAIEQAIASVLPAGVSEGARKRIAEDVFNEVNGTLQNDAALARQVASILRQWRFDDTTQQQVVNLIFGRAKSLIPVAAKRILSDWTSSLLTANREKTAKQQAAASRVDIVGGGAPGTVANRLLGPKDIDYRKTTDDQILGL